MNIKRIIGASLTALGTGGFIYVAILFIVTLGWEHEARAAITCALFSVIFFVSGIGMVNATKDQA